MKKTLSPFPMEESWLLKAAAYVELNLVKAGMVNYAWAILGAASMHIYQEKRLSI